MRNLLSNLINLRIAMTNLILFSFDFYFKRVNFLL